MKKIINICKFALVAFLGLTLASLGGLFIANMGNFVCNIENILELSLSLFFVLSN